MSEFVRSVISQLNGLVGKSNSSTRRVVRLPLSISMTNEGSNRKGRQSYSEGFTCDLSKNGLSFIVSSINLEAKHLFCDKDSALQITIELPSGPVDVNAVAVRYDRLQGERESGFLIGARIVKMNEKDRARYCDFLRKPSNKMVRDAREKVTKLTGAVSK